MSLMSHNQEVYNKICISYKTNNDVILIHGTGMGKSYIVLELLEKMFCELKVLFVVPTWDVADNFMMITGYNNIKDRLDFCTYNYFSSKKKTVDILNSFDLFIFDEAHHLGSNKYGKNASEIIRVCKKKNKYVLGLTATNKREDKTDIADMFSDVIVGISLFEAIQRDLIPPFEYLICGTDLKRQLEYYNVSKNDIKEELDLYKSLPLLKDVISKNPRKRWMVFFSSIKDMNDKESLIRQSFPLDYKIIKISSKDESRVTDITQYERTVVLSVDKLIEGIHTPDTQGLVLFRKITSLRVFQQVLGRVININSEISPLVLDCTNTAFKMFRKLDSIKYYNNEGLYGKNIGKMKKPILTCSIQNVEYYNLEKMLSKMDEEIRDRSFKYRGVTYSSLSSCCLEYKIKVKSVLQWERKNNKSRIDAVEHFVLAKERKEKENENIEKALLKYFSLNGNKYSSLEELKKSNDFKKLKACAKIYLVDISLLCEEVVI